MSPRKDNGLIKEALFREYLRTKGLSYTYERRHILKEILETSKTIKHFTIDRLYNNLQAKRNRISKSTLYRTIKLLEDSRIVKKTDIAPDHYVYEKVEQYNIGHVVCLKCKKIIEINHRETKKIVNSICRKKRFQYKTHTFEIKGYCNNCVSLSLKDE
ncbi:MAG: Ferric uptake regulation protein [Candidatus Scalindua arabica]|uniref:Ferric uptake regulation protein n=1 Tax=Candidatus Scalindua arabica TaxID=1127984 RepID=A0A941W435_9BACT|nr:Ferric uptake regulation protein [Candidatus Scalindua arabica]